MKCYFGYILLCLSFRKLTSHLKVASGQAKLYRPSCCKCVNPAHHAIVCFHQASEVVKGLGKRWASLHQAMVWESMLLLAHMLPAWVLDRGKVSRLSTQHSGMIKMLQRAGLPTLTGFRGAERVDDGSKVWYLGGCIDLCLWNEHRLSSASTATECLSNTLSVDSMPGLYKMRTQCLPIDVQVRQGKNSEVEGGMTASSPIRNF